MTAADPKRNLARSSELPVHAPYRLCSALEYPTASVAIGWANEGLCAWDYYSPHEHH